MANTVHHFIGLFKAELEDLLDDVQHLEDRWKTRYESRDITAYVYQENNALLHLEYESVRKLLDVVNGIKCDEYTSIDEIQKHVLKLAEDLVSRFEEPQAVMALLKRKIDKVRSYMSVNDEPLS